MATEHATRDDAATEDAATEDAAMVEYLADQLRYAAPDQQCAWPEEWADRADPADWQDYAAPAPGATRWIATVWPDYDTSINDCDAYGRVSDAYDYHDGGRGTTRPPWATGAARKIQVDRGSWVWWQPYVDGHKVYNDPATVRHVRDLLEMGFYGATVERQTVGPYGYWHTADVTSLGGLDTRECEYLRGVIADMIREVAP